MPEDEYGVFYKNPPKKTYPMDVMINGEKVTIVDTISIRFLSQTIVTNTQYSAIKTKGASEEFTVQARVMVHISSDGKKIIHMDDPIFHPNGRMVVVKEEGYVYDSYSKAIEEYKSLGYENHLKEWSKNDKRISGMIQDRNIYIMEWWLNEKR